MTVQEIQEIGFEKAVFGGYDMKSVDTFLERVAEEFASIQKENAALKAKMKVLVDKIEEYRGMEDGMRRALMSAQTVAQDTIEKAKKDADEIVTAAKSETEDKVKSAQDNIVLEEQKLEMAKKSTVEFIARISAAYQAQAKSLVELVKSENLIQTQENVRAEQQQAAQEQTAKIEKVTENISADEPVEDATRKFDFGELKFGAEYDPKEEK